MTAENFIRNGDLDGALAAARDAVRSNPAEPKHRIFLFQLECVLGHWEKAFAQLQILSELDADSRMFAAIFAPVLECEILRRDIFEGKKTPIIFGEPNEWMGDLVQANRLAGDGQYAASAKLRATAFDKAPPSKGTIDGQPFEWLADSDPRLGPMLEVIMDGCYRWVPFLRISSIHTEPPADLRDLVWIAAQFSWTNGGTAAGFIPARYAGSESSSDAAVRLGRRTEWAELPEGLFVGSGQRMLATDQGEYPLLQAREISLETVTEALTTAENV